MKQIVSVVWAVLLVTVVGCSSHSEDSSTPLSGSDNSVDRGTMLALVNEVRAKGCNCGTTYMPPVGALVWNDKLEQAALLHTQDMYVNNFFDHAGSNGSTPSQRVTAAGYSWMATGENIATGYLTEKAVMDAWLASEGHCKNIMYANFKDFGAARVGNYWTQEFGVQK